MKQGRWIAAFTAFAIVAGAAGMAELARAAGSKSQPAGAVAAAAAAKTPARKTANSMRQFTGWVTAVDKSGLTVEKRGKTARTMTFVRHEEMKAEGEIAKEARVTVYYREEGGRAVAHRVVVKESSARG